MGLNRHVNYPVKIIIIMLTGILILQTGFAAAKYSINGHAIKNYKAPVNL
jgi:hypothetical protein